MDQHPSAADLARVPLFHELSPEALAVLASRFEIESFDAGRTIVAEGRSGYAFYVLAGGVATVTVDGESVRTLGPGDHFGEIAILDDDDGRRTATVTATEPVVAWSLFGTSFRVLQSEHPDVADALELATRERLASDGTWRD